MGELGRMKRLLRDEAQAIRLAAAKIGPEYEQALKLIADCRGKLIWSGMGKSGYVAVKAAATFASLGYLSVFLHPADALHGGSGLIRKDDLVIFISNSGETDEILVLLPIVKTIGATSLCLTAEPRSPIGEAVDLVLPTHIGRKFDLYGALPTASSTVVTALCDALAVSYCQLKNIRPEDLHHFHPGGSIGKKLISSENR